MAKRYAPNVYVPCAVVERAWVHDMIYAACPRCATSLNAALQHLPLDRISVLCPACGVVVATDAISYKYRFKLQLLFDMAVRDAMLFNEPAEALLGAPANRLRKLVLQYPSLSWLLEELLLGLCVSFSYQPAENRQPVSSHSNTTTTTYQRDLKVISLQPLVPVLAPQPLIKLAMAQLSHDHNINNNSKR